MGIKKINGGIEDYITKFVRARGGDSTGLDAKYPYILGNPLDVENSLRFNDDDEAYLEKTFGTPTNSRIGTFSFWCKLGKSTDAEQGIFKDKNSNKFWVGFDINLSGDYTFGVYCGNNGTPQLRVTSSLFRDHSAWYHIIMSIDTTNNTASDRLKLYVNGEIVTNFTTNSVIDQDVEVFYDVSHVIGRYANASEQFDGYLADVHFVDGTVLDASSFGMNNAETGRWVPKDCSEDLTYGTNGFYLKFDNTADLGEDSSGNDNDWTAYNLMTEAGPNDGRTWSSNTSGGGNATVAFNANGPVKDDYSHSGSALTVTFNPPISGDIIVYGGAGGNATYDFTLSDGSVLSSNNNYLNAIPWDELDYGAKTNITSLHCEGGYCLYAVSVNGSYLVDGRDDGGDAAIDVLADSPSTYDDGGNGVGNYCTLNPLMKSAGSLTPTLSDGNLTAAKGGSGGWQNVGSTFSVSDDTGKWYWEVEWTAMAGTYESRIGVAAEGYEFNRDTTATGLPWLGSATGTSWSLSIDGNSYTGGSSTAYTSALSATDVIGVALDTDAHTLTFYKNGSSLGQAYSSVSSPVLTPAFAFHANDANTINVNFGARSFAYTPPTNHKALNTYNLGDTEILSGTYEGNGDADGPVVWMNATPATLKIGTSDPATSLVTFSPTTVDRLVSGFKIRHASTNNGSGTTYYWLATIDKAFKYANAQTNE